MRLARARASPTSPSQVVVLQAVDSPSLVATPLEAFLVATPLEVTPLEAFLVAIPLVVDSPVVRLLAHPSPLEDSLVVTLLGASLSLVAVLLAAASPAVLAYLSQLVASLVVVLSEVHLAHLKAVLPPSPTSQAPPARQKAVLPASLSHLVDFLSQVHLLPDA